MAMKKRTTMGLLGLAASAAGAAGGLAAVGSYIYNRVMIPQIREDPKGDEPYPTLAEGRAWAQAGAGFRGATIQSPDGLKLWAAVIPAEQGEHRWAICIHGFNSCHHSMGAIARHYHEAGWNVLLPDQRGYGNSQGDFVGWGYAERLDLLGWINYVIRRDPQAELLLHGVSMGAATVLMATGGPLPHQVKAAVSDCSYTTIEAEMRHVLSAFRDQYVPTKLPVPTTLLFSALRQTTLHRAGYDLRDASPLEAVANSKTPTLFIHGVKDDFVPASMMGKLYQAARCPKSFLWMPDADHATSVGADPALYWTTVSTFLEEYIQ
jgi:hypothetical protein